MEAVADGDVAVAQELVPINERADVLAPRRINVEVRADPLELLQRRRILERLPAVGDGQDHARNVVLVAEGLEEPRAAQVLRLGPGGVVLGVSGPLDFQVCVLVVERAVDVAAFAGLIAILRTEVVAVLVERGDGVHLDADRVRVPPGRVPGLPLGGHQLIRVAVPAEQEVRAGLLAAHQRREPAVARGGVQHDRGLVGFRRRAEMPHLDALAGAAADLERSLAGDLPLLDGEVDAALEFLPRLQEPALLPAISDFLPIHLRPPWAERGP